MRSNSGIMGKFFASRAFLLVGIIVLIFLTLTYTRAYYQNYLIREEIKREQQKISSLQGKKLEIFNMLARVKSPDYVEEKARTELNLVKKGENVTVISGIQKATVSRQTENNVLPSKKYSNPRLWWNYFFSAKGKSASGESNS